MAGEDAHVLCCFEVTICDFIDGDTVCLSGSHQNLGHWEIEGLKTLEQKQDDRSVWTLSCKLPVGEHFYRYAVVRQLVTCRRRASRVSQTVLQEFESLKRSVVVSRGSSQVCVKDTYGQDSSSSSHVDRGILTRESEIQLRICREKHDPPTPPIQFHGQTLPVDKDVSDLCDICIEPFWFAPQSEEYDLSAPCPPLSVKTLVSSSGRCIGPVTHNSSDWVKYCIDNTLVFTQQTLDASQQAFKVHVRYAPQDGSPVITGHGCMLPEQIHEARNNSRVNVLLMDDNMTCIGRIFVNCLVITPYRHCHDLSETYALDWTPSKCLCIGHRGMGGSESMTKNSASFIENTIPSFAHAAKVGASMVEFDVLLTSDRVPVVFHDFTFMARLPSQTQDVSKLELSIHLCSLTRLRSLDIDLAYRPADGKVSSTSADVDHLDLASSVPLRLGGTPHPNLFPTLEEVFARSPADVSFDVELKYPLACFDPLDVVASYFDRNEFVDIILETVFRCAGQREIVFSCFCPDVCTMLRRKQGRYPVIFLSEINSPDCDVQDDTRISSLNESLAYTHSEQLRGIACKAMLLVEDPLKIDDIVQNHKLLVLTWGGFNSTLHNVIVQSDHGVLGVCSDSVDRNIFSTQGAQ